MKITQSKIKRWGFKQRLHEIKKRVDEVWNDPFISRYSTVILSEAQNIIDYWITHMEGPVEPEKPKKKNIKKPQNLWDEVL